MTRGKSARLHSPPQTALSPVAHRQVFAYMDTLMLLMALCDPNSGLLDIPVSFLLKNAMQLDALQISQLRL
jgi:hypothetical protein